MIENYFRNKQNDVINERIDIKLKHQLSVHQRSKQTSDISFREIRDSGFDGFLNDLQIIILEESKIQFKTYCEKINDYYMCQDSRKGMPCAICPDDFKMHFSKSVFSKVNEYLNNTYPELLDAIANSEKYIGKFDENKLPEELFSTFLWILPLKNFKQLKELEKEIFEGVSNFSLFAANVNALNAHWKNIIIISGPTKYGECADYLCYDSELKFLFRLYPNDNYRHWCDYAYSFENGKGLELITSIFEISTDVPIRYKHSYEYFSRSLPELANRKKTHLSLL